MILYNLSTHEIIGVSAVLTNNSGPLTEPTLKACFPDKKIIPNVGALSVPNDEQIANELYEYELQFSRAGEPIGLELKPPQPYIELSTDALDRDRNGIPELKADGRSKAIITASLRDHTGKLLTGSKNEVHFVTTGGVLLKRIVKCKNGVAKTALQAINETIISTITAKSNGCRKGSMKIEFVHPDDKL